MTRNKDLVEVIMNYSFIIMGYRSFLKNRLHIPDDEADEYVANYLENYQIDPVKVGFRKP